MNQSKSEKRVACRNCGNVRAVIKKYRINLCRRCFKELAERIGFSKFD